MLNRVYFTTLLAQKRGTALKPAREHRSECRSQWTCQPRYRGQKEPLELAGGSCCRLVLSNI
jgi:hypothetical protein